MPETESVIVPWWSLGKISLAAGVLVLIQEGKLNLDTPFEDKKYTLRQLLQHTSGLPDYSGMKQYHEAVARGDKPWSSQELFQKVDTDKLLFDPGTAFAYSNIGYLFVREEIERITGKDLETALNDLVFNKLDLSDIRVANSQADAENVSGIQVGYDPAWVFHGLMISPLSSAALFLDRLSNTDFLSPKLKVEMLSPYLVSNKIPGRPFENPSYGLGLMMGMVNGKLYVGHTGQGPKSTIAVYSSVKDGLKRTVAGFVRSDKNEDQGKMEDYIFRKLFIEG